MPDNCSILHIEDDEWDHILFRRDLTKLQFTGDYQRKESFDQAKQYLEQCIENGSRCPDVIVADSRLGLYNGLDIVKWIKQHEKLREIPVVVYSAGISPRDSAEVLREGAVACLTKPIDSIETLASLKIILGYIKRRCAQQKSPGDP
jgi:CheY-like chemotaxis protein